MSERGRDTRIEDLAERAALQAMRAAQRACDVLESAEERLALLQLMAGAVAGMAAAERIFDGKRDASEVSDAERNIAFRATLASLLAAVDAEDHSNAREPLPLRRTGGSIDFHWQDGWLVYTVGFSLYPDSWRAAEIFLNVSKSEGMAEANARDAGILASFALQHGATLDQLVEAVTHEPDGSASSIVGTALNLVQAEIARLRDAPRENPGDDGVSPLAPNAGPGDGGAGAAAVPTSDAKDDPEEAPIPADPKELQNDGCPIRATRMLWLACARCGCRHAPGEPCPSPEDAAARLAEDRRNLAEAGDA